MRTIFLQAEGLLDVAKTTDFTMVGVMAVIIVALAVAVIHLWKKNNTNSAERLEDLKDLMSASNENNTKFLIILEQIKERLK